jgi:hypothetical protein
MMNLMPAAIHVAIVAFLAWGGLLSLVSIFLGESKSGAGL